MIKEQDELPRAALAGDGTALAALFVRERPCLKRMIPLRLDGRLIRGVDPDDVLQESYLDVLCRFDEYRRQYADSMPLRLWFRLILGQRLVDLHRQHLGIRARDAGLEVSLYRGDWPQATSASLAAQLLGKLTSASRAAIRAEQRLSR